MSDIIREGHIRRGYIEEVEGLHGSLRFKFTPMLGEVVEATENEVKSQTPSKAYNLVCAQVAKHLKWWDEGAAEKPEPHDFDTVRHLMYPKLMKLYRIVAGMSPSDLCDWVSEDPNRVGISYADEVLANVNGTTPGDVSQEGQEGN